MESSLIFIKQINTSLTGRIAQRMYSMEKNWFLDNWGASNLYIIGKRKKILFHNIELKDDEKTIEITINYSKSMYSIKFSLGEFCNKVGANFTKIGLHEQMIQLEDKDNPEKDTWLTPDRLFYLLKYLQIDSVSNLPKEIFQVKALYIGESKNSVNRLFKNAHHKLQEILLTEDPIEGELRDEILISFFKVEQTKMSTFEGTDIDMFIEKSNKLADNVQIYKDAEKALIWMLETRKYNVESFNDYPSSVDGLYKENYTRYAFSTISLYDFWGDSRHLYSINCFSEEGIYYQQNEASHIFIEGNQIMYLEGENLITIKN